MTEPLSLKDKANVVDSVAKALEDPKSNTVARRVVMPRSVWEVCQNLAKRVPGASAADVASVALQAGLQASAHYSAQAQGAAQSRFGPDGMLTLEARANIYAETFPDYPRLIVDKGWLLGVWNIGNNYKGSGYYGAYPPSYLKRITPLFPDCPRVLHLFSGSLPPGDYVRFDIRDPSEVPNGVDVQGDAEKLSHYFQPGSFDIIFADPPYSEDDAQRYGRCLVNRNKVVAECARVVRPGGFLIWMDQVLPMYRGRGENAEWNRCIEISISRSTNHRVRAVFGFQRLNSGSALPPSIDEMRAEALEF